MLNKENIYKVYEVRKSDSVSTKTQSSSLTHSAGDCTTTKFTLQIKPKNENTKLVNYLHKALNAFSLSLRTVNDKYFTETPCAL